MASLSPHSDYWQPISRITQATAVVDDNPRVADVEQQFRRIADHGDELAATDSGLFVPHREFRYTNVNQEGVNAARNHFQGMQRLRTGQHLVISGGDSTEPASHVFVIRMGTRRSLGPWGSNLLFTGEPAEEDGIVCAVALHNDRWHAGGLGVLGDILAVPVYGGGTSEIVFLHLADPESPTRLPESIVRRNNARANAVTLAKLADGRFVCAVWWEDSSREPVGRIDFYVSKDDDFLNGFESRAFTWQFTALGPGDDRDPKYQAINFVAPTDAASQPGGVTRLYLVGTENGAAAAPLGNGPNLADLFEVTLSGDMFGDTPNGQEPTITWVASREFHASREYTNFDAAAGAYVSSSGMLSLYGGYHWRVNNTVRFSEFSSRPDPETAITDMRQAWIELYEHDTFRGRRLGIAGTDESSIPDYRAIYVQGGDFDDKVSSVRYQIPEGKTYRLYRDVRFAGTRRGEHFIDLKGKGTMVEEKDLKRSHRKFGDKVSSSQYV